MSNDYRLPDQNTARRFSVHNLYLPDVIFQHATFLKALYMLIISYIALCLLFIVYLYTLSVRIEGKIIINVRIPCLIITVPTLYVFEVAYLYNLSECGELYSRILLAIYHAT